MGGIGGDFVGFDVLLRFNGNSNNKDSCMKNYKIYIFLMKLKTYIPKTNFF